MHAYPAHPSLHHERAFTCSPAAMRKALPVLLCTAFVVVVAVERRKEEDAAAGKGMNAQVWGRSRRRRRGRRERAIVSACAGREITRMQPPVLGRGEVDGVSA